MVDVIKSLRVAISNEELRQRIRALGKEINEYYGDNEYIVITVLKGAMFFLTDLVMYLSKKIIIDFMAVSSYYGRVKRSTNTKVVLDVNVDLRQKKVLIVEDIMDSGESLKGIVELLKLRKPQEIKIVTLLRKKHSQKYKIEVDWVGFDIEDRFVVGFGLDYKNNYRNIDYIGYLEV